MSAAGRWSDDRLDDLSRRVQLVEPVVSDVAVLKSEFRTLTKAVRDNTDATRVVAEALEKTRLEPLTRARSLRNALVVAIVASLVGGGIAILGAAISH